MKIFSFLFAGLMANPLMNMLLLDEIEDDTTKMMLMMTPGFFGANEGQHDSMNTLLPLLLLDDSGDSSADMMMLMMMQNPSIINDPNAMLPLLLLGDDNDGGMDFKTLFLLTSMQQKDCVHSTDDQMSMFLPLLLTDSSSTSDSLMMMMMFNSMGNSPIHMNHLMPLILMDDMADDDSLLLMVLMNSMNGGMSTNAGFDSNFNMMLPLLLSECDNPTNDATIQAACDEKRDNMMILMMVMQSQAPNSGFGSNMVLPMLLMDSDSNNEDLLFFMMMTQNTQCLPIEPIEIPVQVPVIVQTPEEPITTIYRTWKVDPVTGERTLVAEGDTAAEGLTN